MISAAIPLEMTKYLASETEFVPWSEALLHLSSWKFLLQETDIVPILDAYIRKLIDPIYSNLGWKDEGDHTERLYTYKDLFKKVVSLQCDS